jgi:cytochrome b involved in lipid metabolism
VSTKGYVGIDLQISKSHTDGAGIVIEDRVYDVTAFRDIHPGGPTMFDQFAGKQCTWQVRLWLSISL